MILDERAICIMYQYTAGQLGRVKFGFVQIKFELQLN